MRAFPRCAAWSVLALVVLSSTAALSQPRPKAEAGKADTPAKAEAGKVEPTGKTEAGKADAPLDPAAATRSSAMTAYNAALAARRLESTSALTPQVLRDKLLEVQELSGAGRRDEVIAALVRLVESPRFADYADSDEGHAAVYGLGDALASAGAHDPARGYLKRLLPLSPNDTYARRAVRRLAEIAIDTEVIGPILEDLKAVPQAGQPEETRGEIAYLTGRQKQLGGDAAGAFAAYAQISQKSRFWAQATYLSGLIEVERGHWKEGENLFCKVADPARSEKTAPFFADEKFYAVRDLARLALGRVAHEQFRFDDSRYYYYLVPQDSERLAEALYESATGRYEKKDYEGAHELLNELAALGVHHRYEDEAWILGAYIDLARCHFEEADLELKGFIAKYEPVRDLTQKFMSDERGLERLLASPSGFGSASRSGDSRTKISGDDDDVARAVAALIRVDSGYGTMTRRLGQLDLQMAGLRGSMGQLDDLNRTLATTGGVRPNSEGAETRATAVGRARAEADGLRHQIESLERAHASANDIADVRSKLDAVEAGLRAAAKGDAAAHAADGERSVDLPGLLRGDRSQSTELYAAAEAARAKLVEARNGLAKDAAHRLVLRLSRLLRRARLGRIESVLGRKRALEVEVEALAAGVLPKAALDSLEAARYLKDNEEYWPFEGDDWPDEYVGAEGLR